MLFVAVGHPRTNVRRCAFKGRRECAAVSTRESARHTFYFTFSLSAQSMASSSEDVDPDVEPGRPVTPNFECVMAEFNGALTDEAYDNAMVKRTLW